MYSYFSGSANTKTALYSISQDRKGNLGVVISVEEFVLIFD
jgi:hypothetical protein